VEGEAEMTEEEEFEFRLRYEREQEAASKRAAPAAPAEPAMMSTRPDDPVYPRRDTTALGVVTEGAKGVGRGITALPKMVSEALASLEGKRPDKPGPAQRMLDRFYEQIQADPTASQAEQMVGTGGELAASMAPFAGAGSLAAKVARVAVPTAGGVAGEQVAGETGKLIGSLAAPLAMKGAAVGNPRGRLNANKQVARELIENRIPVLPSAADAGPIKRGMEGFGGKERVLDLFRQRAQPELQRLASEATGVPAGQLTRANLDEALKNATTMKQARAIQQVKQMLVDADSGIIDTRKAYQLKQQRAKLAPQLDTIAKAGSPMFRPSTMPPVEGAGVPFKGLGDLGTYGRLGVHILTGGTSLALPATRALARHRIASPAGQEALYRHLGDHPGLFGGASIPGPGYTSLATLPLFDPYEPQSGME
jgi:hypothetical protein